MRLYNAHSCTPVGTTATANTRKWSSPRTFLPSKQKEDVGVLSNLSKPVSTEKAVLQEKSLLLESPLNVVETSLSPLPSSSSSPTMPPFSFPLSLTVSGSFSPPRWGPPEIVLFPTPPRNGRHGKHKPTGMKDQRERMEVLKSSPEISKTTTGTTATSSDNENDCDYNCTDKERRSRLHEPFYFDIDGREADDEDRHLILPAAHEPPLSARDYSWDYSSQDSVSTISTWKSFELEYHNPSVKSRHQLEHDDYGGSAGRWESRDSAKIVADKDQGILMPAKSSRTCVPSHDRSEVPPSVKTGDETIWSQSLQESVASDCDYYKLALFPTREPHTPETFGPPLWRAITVPSVERVESDDDAARAVMGPWIDFRLPENPFAPDSEFASSCNNILHSPFAPIEQPPLPPKKSFVVANPQADHPGFFSPPAISYGEEMEMSTETQRDREQVVGVVTPAGSATFSSIAKRVPTIQQVPRVEDTMTKVGRRLESVMVPGKRMSALPSQSIVVPSQASRDAVVYGSKAAAKPANSSITNAKVGYQKMGSEATVEQAFREKESTERRPGSKVVIDPVQVFAVNSISRRQIIGKGTATEMIKSDPVKSFVANSTSTSPNVCQAVTSDPAKSPVVNYKSGCQLLDDQGTVAEQQRQEKNSTDSNKSSCSTQRRAPLLLGRLLEERYQAARRKDVLPLKPDTAGEKNNESSELGNAVRSIQENPALVKYARMLKVGLPISAVKNAMERDGTDMGVFGGEPTGQNEKCTPSILGDDPAFAKYARMLKVGLPISAVKNAMERDGVDSGVLDGGAPRPSTAKKTELVLLEAARDPFRRFRLHWDTHSNVRSNTIWAMVSRDQEWLAEVQVDEEELDTLFRTPTKKSTVVAETSDTTTNRVGSDIAVQVIDPKRANNGGISLARIKLSYRDMARAVESYDIAALTLEQIRGILPYIPTPEETRDLKDSILKGGQLKTECEKFMVEIMTVDKAKRRLEAMIFMKSFSNRIEELKNDARLIHNACDEIMSASRFRKVLGIVLHLGNLLNTAGSSSQDMAGALKVESLLKLHQAKAFDKKTTFLQYAVHVIRRNSPTLLQFKDDLHTLSLAEKINWEQSLDELEIMEASLSEIRQLALASSGEEGQSPFGTSEGEANLAAENEARCLQSTYIGSFTLDASERMTSAYGEIASSKRAFEALLNYFGEEQRSDTGPQKFLSTLSLFCGNFDTAVEQAIASEKQKLRETRLTCSPRYPTIPTKIQRPKPSHKVGPSSAMGSTILTDIRRSSKE